MSDRVEIARWIKEQRTKRGYSAARFAAAIDMHPASIYGWEKETTTTKPAEDKIPRLAEVLELTIPEVRRGLGFYVEEPEPVEPGSVAEVTAIVSDVMHRLQGLEEADLVEVYGQLDDNAREVLKSVSVGVVRLVTMYPELGRRTG